MEEFRLLKLFTISLLVLGAGLLYGTNVNISGEKGLIDFASILGLKNHFMKKLLQNNLMYHLKNKELKLRSNQLGASRKTAKAKMNFGLGIKHILPLVRRVNIFFNPL